MADEKIITLKQNRARAFTEWRSTVEAAEAADRGLTAEERQKVDAIKADIDSLDARIADVEAVRAAAKDEARYADQLDGSAMGQGREDREMAAVAREYRDAFNKYLRVGAAYMERDEVRTLQLGVAAQGESRTGLVVGTNSLGGYTVPQDFANRLFSLKIQAGGVRQSKVQVFTTGDGRQMPVAYASAHGAGSWLTEATAPSDADETFAQTTLHAYPSGRLQLVSIQLLEDSAFDLAAYLTGIFGQKIGRLQNAAFISGSGSGQPTGMINFSGVAEVETALKAGPSSDEVQQWFYTLTPPYRINGEFLMHDSLVQAISLLKSTTGSYLWLPSLRDDTPDMFMGKPVINDPDLQATGTDENVVGMFADFNNFYAIRDVNELNIVRLNERYADSLQVGFLGWQRVDGTVIDTAAGAQLAVGAG